MLSLLSYLSARIREPGSLRGLAVALGFTSIVGIQLNQTYVAWALFGLMLVATVAQFLIAERAKVVAALPAGSVPTISQVVWQALTDAVKSGPHLETLAKQLLDLHAAGSISADELTTILGGITVPGSVPVMAVTVAAPAPAAPAPAVAPAAPAPAVAQTPVYVPPAEGV